MLNYILFLKVPYFRHFCYHNYKTLWSYFYIAIAYTQPRFFGMYVLLHIYAYYPRAQHIVSASASEVAQSCPTLCNPMDCNVPGSSIHGIFQARMLEWVAISFSRGSSRPREQSWVSRTTGRLFTVWATRKAIGQYQILLHSPSIQWAFSCTSFWAYNKDQIRQKSLLILHCL